MYQPSSSEAPLTFCDVVACFSEEEWKLLQHWQKELYKNVMKEIHQAMVSLGPLIATSVFSLRPTEKEHPCSLDFQDLGRRGGINPSSGEEIPQSDYILRKEDEECHTQFGTERCKNNSVCNFGEEMPQSDYILRKGEEECLNTQFGTERCKNNSVCNFGEPTDVAPDVSYNIKIEEELYSRGQIDSERSESTSSATRFTFHSIDVDGHLSDFQCAEREDNVMGLSAESEGLMPVAPIGINEDGATYAINIQDYGGQEIINSASGTRSMNKRKRIDNTLKSKNTLTQCKALAKKVKAESPKIEQPCEKKTTTVHHVSHDVKGRYTCKECGKVFSAMSNLIRHERIHTGERPYACLLCGKSFNQTTVLHRHQKMHTGERPFQCNVCEKRFNEKHHLLAHQNVHKRERTQQSIENDPLKAP